MKKDLFIDCDWDNKIIKIKGLELSLKDRFRFLFLGSKSIIICNPKKMKMFDNNKLVIKK